MKLQLNLSSIDSLAEVERPQTHHSVTNRAALKKGLDIGVVETCLNSLDVFRDLLEGIPQQKNRVVRDVCKNIELKYYSQGDIIYEVGDKAQQVYFCISGAVSICIMKEVPKEMPTLGLNTHTSGVHADSKGQNMKISQNFQATTQNQQIQMQIVPQEIDVVESGKGFGEGEFIGGTKRRLRAVTKQPQTLIGKLEIEHFAQVLQNYKQRIYYKKRDMFMKCSLFSNLSQYQLQFIINNTKPMTINISQRLVKQGSPVDIVYLVNKGQVSLWKTGIQIKKQSESSDEESAENSQLQQKHPSINSCRRNLFERSNSLQDRPRRPAVKSMNCLEKTRVFYSKSSECYSPKKLPSLLKFKNSKSSLIPQESDNKVFMGLMSEGCFIGDMELVLGKPFEFNAICRTQKAELYYCDRRIILSQMSEQNLMEAKKYYEQKQQYLNNKIFKYKTAKENIQKQRQRDLLPPLTKQQIQLKRKIMHRHVQDKPTLIGHCSPRDIQKMLKRKQSRVIKQPEISQSPVLQLFPNHSVKKRSHSPSSFSPLALVQTQCKRILTESDYKQYESTSASPNPQLKSSGESFNLKSMLIQIKNWEPNLKGLKKSRQKNLVVVGKILGRYQECNSQLKCMSELIEKIENNRI